MSVRRNIPSPGGVLLNKTVYEQIQVGNSSQYAMKVGDKIVVEPMLTVGESTTYQPLTPPMWLLPGKPIPYGTIEELWSEVRQFIWDHLDIEIDELYDVLTAWVHTSWVMSRFDSIGYLHFHGSRNSGKTRGLDVLNYLCYRPLLSPSASGAALFRALDAYQPTFLLDEFEMYEKMKEQKAEVIGIMNAGYRRGQVVLRITGMKEGNPVLKGFDVFGPKAISSIQDLPDALRGRCIRLPMTRATRKVRRLIDKERAEELRSKLLQYRFDHLFDEPEGDNPIDLPDGRLIEIYYPLKEVAPTEKIGNAIIRSGQSQYNASIEEDRITLDAQVYAIILDLLEQTAVLSLPQSIIRERCNAGLPEDSKERISKQFLSAILKRMNLQGKMNAKTRLREIIIDPDVLERRKTRYVLQEEMVRVNGILEKVRELKTQTTLGTLGTLGRLRGGQASVEDYRDQKEPEIEKEAIKTESSDLTTLGTLGTLGRGVGGGGVKPGLGLEGKPSVSNVPSVSTEPNEPSVPNVVNAKTGLREGLETLGKILRESKTSLGAEEVAEAAGLEAEETLRLLEVLRRERHAFQVPGGKWRWVA